MAGRDGFTGYGFDAPNDSHIAVHDAYLSNWDASNSVAISVLGGSGDHDDYDYRMDSVEQQVSTSKEDRPAGSIQTIFGVPSLRILQSKNFFADVAGYALDARLKHHFSLRE